MYKILVLYALREIKNLDNDKYYNTLQKFIKSTINSINLNFEVECLIIHNSSIEYNFNLPNNFKLINKKNCGHGWYGWKIGLDSININDYNYYCFIKDKTNIFSHFRGHWSEK